MDEQAFKSLQIKLEFSGKYLKVREPLTANPVCLLYFSSFFKAQNAKNAFAPMIVLFELFEISPRYFVRSIGLPSALAKRK